MTRQHCHECGTDVPVDDVTGLCHVGHRVNSPIAPAGGGPAGTASTAGYIETGPSDEPAPWVATVEDDEAEPRREPDPAAPPPPATALGSATTPPPGTGFDPTEAGGAVETPDLDAPVPGFAAAATQADDDLDDVVELGAAGDDDPSLEELAAMAAMGPADEMADDLAGLGDDLRADLTPEPPAAPAAPATDEFDLDSLEQAVADLGGTASAPPADPAPAPPAAPAPPSAPAPPAAAPVTDEPSEPAASEPVSIRPDHEPATAGAGSSAPLDPTNFTASGKRVSTPKAGSGGDDGLVGKLKGLFGR